MAGYSPFDEGRRFGQDELDILEEDLISMGASEGATDFIYHLLILDEVERMDVRQALQHGWFTKPRHHQTRLDRLYMQAIRGWMPRRDESVIVDLKSKTNCSANLRHPSQEPVFEDEPALIYRPPSIDHISESSYDVPATSTPALESPTLTNIFRFDARTCKGNQFTVFRERPIPQGLDKKVRNLKQEIDQELEDRYLETASKMAKFQVQEDIGLKTPDLTKKYPQEGLLGDNSEAINGPTNEPGWLPTGTRCDRSPSKLGIDSTRKKAPTHNEKEAERREEVYEEVHNPFTGKKRRYIYGRDMESIITMS